MMNNSGFSHWKISKGCTGDSCLIYRERRTQTDRDRDWQRRENAVMSLKPRQLKQSKCLAKHKYIQVTGCELKLDKKIGTDYRGTWMSG